MGTDDELRDTLAHGELVLEGRLLDASNAAFVGNVDGVPCVYKPRTGERELWDFPTGTLSLREVAAYELSLACGFDFVPTTVWREDGPTGPGMCQRWIEHTEFEPEVDVVPVGTAPPDWLVVMRGQAPDGSTVELAHADDARLLDAAFFDALCNNADRKGGHLLVDADEQLWLIDHGVTFHADDKLRTVLWGFAGRALGGRLLEVLARDSTISSVAPYLNVDELRAHRNRVERLRDSAAFPYPGNEWPPLPWPLF